MHEPEALAQRPEVPLPAPVESQAERWLGTLATLPLALIVLLTFVDVFARYLFAAPIRGSLEIVQYAMALVIFLALPLVTRRRGHITVALGEKLFRGAAARWRQRLCDAFSSLALALMTWRLLAQGLSDLESDVRSTVLGLPQAPLAFALAACAALATLWMLRLMLARGHGG